MSASVIPPGSIAVVVNHEPEELIVLEAENDLLHRILWKRGETTWCIGLPPLWARLGVQSGSG